MSKKLSIISKVLLLISAAGLICVLFVPMWKIDLVAPQYPEGLTLKIHPNGLRGNVDIINGLNHYIGMKTLHNEDFIEFTILPYCIVFFALLFAAVAFINKRGLLNMSFLLFLAFGALAIYDFWRWEYNYGHNLDPNAAIIVPGMAYQPPLIGFKQLLNFGAYSYPDTGGWLFIAAGVIVLFCVFWEWRRFKVYKPLPALASCIVLILFSGCSAKPEPIVMGKDNCAFCKMTISDAKYGAEIVTKKGKVYKFDDIHCMLEAKKSALVDSADIKDIYLTDFAGPHVLINARESFLLQGESIHGPMNGNIIAFKEKDSLKKTMTGLGATETSWDKIAK